jgi:hypothetical protein
MAGLVPASAVNLPLAPAWLVSHRPVTGSPFRFWLSSMEPRRIEMVDRLLRQTSTQMIYCGARGFLLADELRARLAFLVTQSLITAA